MTAYMHVIMEVANAHITFRVPFMRRNKRCAILSEKWKQNEHGSDVKNGREVKNGSEANNGREVKHDSELEIFELYCLLVNNFCDEAHTIVNSYQLPSLASGLSRPPSS